MVIVAQRNSIFLVSTYFVIIKLEKLVNGKLNGYFLDRLKGQSPYSTSPVKPRFWFGVCSASGVSSFSGVCSCHLVSIIGSTSGTGASGVGSASSVLVWSRVTV